MFSILSLIWLIVVAGMVAIAPIGQHAFIYAVLYCIGYILMIFLVRSFPPEIKPRKAFAGMIGYMWKRGLYLESGMI